MYALPSLVELSLHYHLSLPFPPAAVCRNIIHVSVTITLATVVTKHASGRNPKVKVRGDSKHSCYQTSGGGEPRVHDANATHATAPAAFVYHQMTSDNSNTNLDKNRH